MITPRYHPEIIGGSEAYSRHFRSGLRRGGVEVRVLTTLHFDIRFEIEAGRDGEIVSSSGELCQVLRCLRDQALRQRLGEEGYAEARSGFAWGRVVDRGLKVLEEFRGP